MNLRKIWVVVPNELPLTRYDIRRIKRGCRVVNFKDSGPLPPQSGIRYSLGARAERAANLRNVSAAHDFLNGIRAKTLFDLRHGRGVLR